MLLCLSGLLLVRLGRFMRWVIKGSIAHGLSTILMNWPWKRRGFNGIHSNNIQLSITDWELHRDSIHPPFSFTLITFHNHIRLIYISNWTVRGGWYRYCTWRCRSSLIFNKRTARAGEIDVGCSRTDQQLTVFILNRSRACDSKLRFRS